MIAMILLGCSSPPVLNIDATPPHDASRDARPDAPDPVTVVFLWTHFETSAPCMDPPACQTPACNTTTCTCHICASASCAPYTLTQKCCNASARVRPSDLGRLAADYSRCTLAQTTATTYSLYCQWDANPPVYWPQNQPDPWAPVEGLKFPYTNDAVCEWQLPYGVP